MTFKSDIWEGFVSHDNKRSVVIFWRVRKIAKRDCWHRHVCPPVRPSSWNNSAPTERIFMKFDISVFCENLCRKSKLYRNLTRITDTLHEEQYTCLILSRWILLRMGNALHKSCRENQNTRFVFIMFFFFENCAVYEIILKNVVEPGRPQMTIRRTHITCWIPKATNTHPKYVILIAFPLQQCLHERNTYIVCLVICLCSFPSFVFSLFLHSSFFSQEIQNETKAQMDGRVDLVYRL